MIDKDKDLDRWQSVVRAPFESIFFQYKKPARYRGHPKVKFKFFMDAMVQHVNRLGDIHMPLYFKAHSAPIGRSATENWPFQ